MKNKTIICFLLIGLVSVFLICSKSSDNVTLDEVRLKDVKEENSMFAIYIETKQNDGSYKYVESDDSAWPNGARYNTEKSGCVDSNNQVIVDALTYNNDTNKVSLKTKGAIYCYLYFDLETESRPYEIQYIEDLVDLAEKANNGESFEGKYFALARDLDFKDEKSYYDYTTTKYGNINGVNDTETLMDELTNTEGTGFPPIGKGNIDGVVNRFNGNFDGKDHTIANLHVKGDYHVGLFGLVGKSGSTNTFKNLTITGDITKIGTGNGHAGGLAASSSATNLIIDNVHNKANVTNNTAKKLAGGIVAYVSENVDISNSSNSGGINGSSSGAVGGLVGSTAEGEKTTNLINSINTGDINSNKSEFIGGIIGDSQSSIKIISSVNKGKISDNYSLSDIGGIAGRIIHGFNVILNSANFGNISSSSNYSGGLVGYLVFYNNDRIINSFNLDNLDSNSSYSSGITRSYGNSSSYHLYIDNVYNAGTSKYGIAYKGGSGSISATNTYYINTISTDEATGSVAMSESDMKISDLSNTNGLLYKLNNYVKDKNSVGLGTIDSSLEGYTLDEWVIDPITQYPILKWLLENR